MTLNVFMCRLWLTSSRDKYCEGRQHWRDGKLLITLRLHSGPARFLFSLNRLFKAGNWNQQFNCRHFSLLLIDCWHRKFHLIGKFMSASSTVTGDLEARSLFVSVLMIKRMWGIPDNRKQCSRQLGSRRLQKILFISLPFTFKWRFVSFQFSESK